MKQPQHKKTLMIRLITLYSVTLLLLIVVFSAFIRPKPKVEYKEVAVDNVMSSDQMQGELTRRDSEIVKLQALITDLSKTAGTANGDIPPEELTRLQSELTSSNAQISELQAQLSLSNAAATKTSESAKEIVRLQGELNERTAQLSLAQKDSKELTRLQAELKTKSAQLAVAQKPVANKPVPVVSSGDAKEIQRLRNEVAAGNKQIKQLHAQVTAIRKSPVSASLINGDGSSVADLQKRNDNLVKGFNTLQTQMGLLQKQYNLTKAENNRLKDQVRN